MKCLIYQMDIERNSPEHQNHKFQLIFFTWQTIFVTTSQILPEIWDLWSIISPFCWSHVDILKYIQVVCVLSLCCMNYKDFLNTIKGRFKVTTNMSISNYEESAVEKACCPEATLCWVNVQFSFHFSEKVCWNRKYLFENYCYWTQCVLKLKIPTIHNKRFT